MSETKKSRMFDDITDRTIVTVRFEDGKVSVKVGSVAEFNGRSATHFIDVADTEGLVDLLSVIAEKYEKDAFGAAVKALLTSGN